MYKLLKVRKKYNGYKTFVIFFSLKAISQVVQDKIRKNNFNQI